MNGHGPYCSCFRCQQEGMEDADPTRAEERAEDAAYERAHRQMDAADDRYRNYPEGWADAS